VVINAVRGGTNTQRLYAIGVAHLMRKYTPEEYISVFWSHVNKNGSMHPYNIELGRCWEWTGRLNPSGYGDYGSRSRHMFAHRLSWTISNGNIPDGFQILHSCDNRICVNPMHLFLGTNYDNVLDRERKGRGNQVKGEKHHKCKITDIQVIELRENYASGLVTQRQLSKKYGISQAHVGRIIRKLFRKEV